MRLSSYWWQITLYIIKVAEEPRAASEWFRNKLWQLRFSDKYLFWEHQISALATISR